MSVDILDQERNEMKMHSHNFVLWKRKWEEHRELHTLDWQFRKLADSEKSSIPSNAGIYTLIVQPGIANHPACSYLIYVGQTKSLNRRFGEYLKERQNETGRPKISYWLRQYPNHTWFYFSLVSRDYLDDAEDSLLCAYLPPANDRFPATVRRVINAF